MHDAVHCKIPQFPRIHCEIMADPSEIVVDPPDFGCGLSVPPLDDTFFSQQLTGDDGGLGDNQNDVVSLDDLDLDFDLDFSLDDLCIPSSDLEELLNPTQLQQPDSYPVTDPDFFQFPPDSDQFPDHAIFESAYAKPRYHSGDGALSADHSSNGSRVLSSSSPIMDFNPVSDYHNLTSPESNGSNGGIPEKCDGAANGMNYPSPESLGSGNCRSNVSEESNNPAARSVSSSPDSNNSSIKVRVVDKKIKLDDSAKNNKARSSLLKRKKEGEELMINKCRKATCETDNKDSCPDNCGLSEEEKRKARLVRNRESAHLSRQRKKHYVEELEDKVKSMHATIQDLNMKISYVMAENVTLRQQMGGAGGTPPIPMAPPAHGMYPQPAMMYPWMPYAPPYMVKPQGSQVPLVPIPRLKPQQPASAPKASKKVDNKKKERQKTKKVASVSFLGLLFFIMLFGGLVPIVNVRYGGIKEAFIGKESYIGGGNHHGRVLMVNGTDHGEKYGGTREFRGNSSVHCGNRGQCIGKEKEFLRCNGSEPLTASLYVPRNDKLVKIDGNLIIHSILASEKAMASNRKEGGETGLAVREGLSPAIPVAGVTRTGARHPPLRATDGKIQEWFREGLAGPMLTSGMCTEVFQFDVSSAIVPAKTPTNISEDQNQNSTQLGQQRNRRILYDHPIPLPKSSRNISEREKLNGSKNASSSSVVVSVLVDPREAGDADVDGVLGTKSLSRIFVVVLIDSVKYVTYSCILPFKGSTAPHLVTT